MSKEPRALQSFLRIADGVRHPKGDVVIVGRSRVDHDALQAAWQGLEAEALQFIQQEYGADYGSRAELLAQHWQAPSALLPIGRTDTGGIWLLDLSDPTDPDPMVYRAEIASVSIKPAFVSLGVFLVWLVCRAHCETRDDFIRLEKLVGDHV